MLSTLTIVMAVAPIVGPLLGGQMIKFTSWHAIFWLLTAIGVFMLLSLYWLPETLPIERRVSASLSGAFRTYCRLLSHVNFMKFTLCLTFYYVAVYAFIAGSPFVYITHFHVEPQHYGWLFAVNIVGVMGLSAVNRHLVQRYPMETLLKRAILIAAIAALILAVATKLSVGGIALIVIAIFILFSMNGIIAVTATAAALDTAPDAAGSASALIGSLQYGSGIISSLLLSIFSDGTPWTMGWIITLFTLASAAMAFTTRISKQSY